ncbi:MAG TPA: hypothetical protein VI248_25830 [Kineosporiaceae bacterium]
MEEHTAVRRLVRAVCVLDGVGATATADGVLAPGCSCGAAVGWPEVARLLRDDDPITPAPRRRLALLLELHHAVEVLGPAATEVLARALRPLALPAGHLLHPGPEWVHERVPGDVLDVGLGVWRLLPGDDEPVPLPPSVIRSAQLDPTAVWAALRPLTERLACFAIDRAEAGGTPPRALAGVGGADALTMLTVPAVRAWLAGLEPGPPTTARPEAPAVSAPRRDRVWIGTAAADQDYARAVWLLTAPARRGLPEPLTVATERVTRTPATRDHAHQQ